LLFVGHTHCPSIHVIGKSKTPHLLPANDFTLEAGKRYIVNPGSIGYPRSQEGRSTYCIYDDHAKTVVFRSLPFDHESYVASLRKAGFEVEPWLAQQEAAQNIPELRERLSFAKPLAEHQYAQRVRQEARPRRLRYFVLFAICSVLLWLVSVVQNVYDTKARIAQSGVTLIPDRELETLNAYPLVPADRNLLPAFQADWQLPIDGPLPGWRFRASGTQSWGMWTESRNGVVWLGMILGAFRQFTLESPLISLAGTQVQSVRMRGRVQKPDGSVMFQLITYAEQEDGTLEQIAVNSFEPRDTRGEPSGTFSLNRKINIPVRTTHLRFCIETPRMYSFEIEQPVLTAETTRGKK